MAGSAFSGMWGGKKPSLIIPYTLLIFECFHDLKGQF